MQISARELSSSVVKRNVCWYIYDISHNIQSNQMHCIVFRYSVLQYLVNPTCNIEYLKTIECIWLDCILCDFIDNNAQYEQYKK
jgi:hypothetical protein